MRYFVTVLGLLFLAVLAQSQQPTTKSEPLPWTLLTDPVCPVSSFYDPPLPNATKELRVMYFPSGRNAKLTNPQSLTLQIGLNEPSRGGQTAVIPFTRKEDHWEAVVPIQQFNAMYAIFFVRDDKTGEIDDNGGQLWDVVFCEEEGNKDANGIRTQIRGYSGESWSATIRRQKNYDKAISILKTALSRDSLDWLWMPELWKIEAQRDGNDAKAWAKIAKEIDEFARNHPDKKDWSWIGNFLIQHQEQLPADFVESFITAADAKQSSPHNLLREQFEYSRAFHQPNADKRLAALDAFIAKYPQSRLAGFAQSNRFVFLVERKDLAGAEAALAAYRESEKHETRGFRNPNDYNMFLQMARLYIEKQVKLDEALKFTDLAQGWIKGDPRLERLDVRFTQQIDAQSMLVRALAYLALKQPAPALEQIRKSFEIQKTPESYFVLAQALAANGQKKEALDAYFEAALQPSNKDLEYTAALADFYLKEHLGDRRQFGAEMDKRRAERFRSSNYKPELVDKPAPAFEFVTLRGESFDSEKLSSKTVVVNFWSPG